MNKLSPKAVPGSLGLFTSLLLTFSILITPIAAVARTTESPGVRGQRSDSNRTRNPPKAAANETFANPAPVFAASPVISASMTDSIENDDGDGKIDPTDGTGSTERIIYSTTISNSAAPGTVDATGVQFTDTIDAHTTLLPGSVNVSPLADDDSYDTIGNTLLEVGPVGSPSSQPKVTVGTVGSPKSVFDNDTEFLGDTFTLSKLQATTYPGSGTITAASTHGSVTIDGSGHFSYLPTAGYTGDDTFTYEIKDSGNLIGTGTVTIHVNAQRVWYVQNNSAGTNQGTSENPFTTLAAAQGAANAAGDIVYVFNGNNTTSGQNAGFTFQQNNQRLIGEGVELDAPVSVNGGANPTVLRAAGSSAHIGNSGGDAVTAANRSGIIIRGFIISDSANGIAVTDSVAGGGVTISNNSIAGGTGNAIDVTSSATGGGSATITNNAITAATAEGIDINANGSGTLNLTVDTNTISSTGNGFDVQENAGACNVSFTNNTGITSSGGSGVNIVRVTGTLSVTAFSGNQIAGTTGGNGVVFSNAIFDSNPATAAADALVAGALNIGASGNGVGASGLVLVNTTGSLPFTTLDIHADSGRGIDATGASSATAGLTANAGAVIAAIGGAAVFISGMTVNLQSAVVTSTNSSDNGVMLGVGSGVDGTFSATNASSISNAAGDDFAVGSGTATITWNASLTNNSGGNAVDVTGHSGGTVSFTGAITDTVQGINLSTNASTTFSFSGGLSLNGTSSVFVATQGVSNPSSLTISGTNTIGATTAPTTTALNITNTTIAAGGVTFQKINAGTGAGSAGDGIILDTTGNSGGNFSITGTGTAASGGTIQHKTGSDGATTSGIGIYLNSTRNISLARMQLNDFDNFAIRGLSVNGFTISDSVINGTNGTFQGSPNNDGSVRFDELTGTSSLTNTSVSNGMTTDLTVQNLVSGSVLTLNITGCTFTGRNTASVNTDTVQEIVLVGGNNPGDSPTMTANISTTDIANFDARGIQVAGNGASTMTVNIGKNGVAGSGGNFTGMPAAMVDIAHNGTGNFSFNVERATFSPTNAAYTVNSGATVPINIFNGSASGSGTTFQGRVLNNQITGQNNSGFDGIALTGSGAGTMTVQVDSNTVTNVAGNGISYTGAQNSSTNTSNLTITNNTCTMPDPNAAFGVQVSAQASSSATATVNAKIANNNVVNLTAGPDYRVDSRFSTSNLNMPGYVGGSQDTTAVKNYVAGLNKTNGATTTSADVSASIGLAPGGHFGNTAGGADPALPGNANPLMFGPGGVEAARETASLFDVLDIDQSAFGNVTTSALTNARIVTTSLDQQQLDQIVAAAVTRWSHTGLTQPQLAILHAAKFEIGDLPGIYLGEVDGDRVLIDRNAGGRGWYVGFDQSSDEQFTNVVSNTRRYTNPIGAPAGHVDLLSAIEHEMGHKLGLDDSYAAIDRDSIMYGYLAVGERRTPSPNQAKIGKPTTAKSAHLLALAAESEPAVVLIAGGEVRAAEVVPSQSVISRATEWVASYVGAVVSNIEPTAYAETTKSARTRNSVAATAAAAPFSGETVTFDNGGSGFTLPVGKSVTIVFKVTLNNLPNVTNNPYPTGGPQVSNQGRVFGTNFTLVNGVSSASVDTDDPAPPAPLSNGTHDPTVTYADLFNTTTAVNTSVTPSFQGDSVTFTATVSFNPTGSPSGSPGTPTGSVQFKDGATNITCDEGPGARPLNGSGVAVCTTSGLSAAVHTINADYLGDGNFDTSTGNTTQTVNACTVNPVVTTTGDTGAGSLRDAIGSACTNSTITFATGAGQAFENGGTIVLGSELTIGRNLTIDGPDAANQKVTVSGNNVSRVFNIQSGKTDTIRDLTISGGNTANQGGGILNDGTLTLINCTVSGNTAQAGGGILNTGMLTLTNSTVCNNSVNLAGGGILNNSTLTLTNSTVSGNAADRDGGGISGIGTLALTNCTITNNRADNDDDTHGTGGGLLVGGTATIYNTIVAGNFKGTGLARDDVNGSLDAGSSFNLIGDGTGMTGIGNSNGNQVGTNVSPIDAILGALANNGGPTLTHALLAGSPAIEAGDNTSADNAGLTTDQRGTGFPRKADSADSNTTQTVDIGAYELHPTIQDIADTSTNEDTIKNVIFNLGDDTGSLITGGGGSVTASSSNTTLVPNLNANLSFTGSGGSRTLQITPAANENGTTTITVTVTATNGQTAQDSFVLTVNPVNDNPNANGETIGNIAEDCSTGCTSGVYVISFASLLANDNSGPANESTQTINISNVGSAVGGTVGINGTNVEFTPTADFNGAASFQYTVTDDGAPPASAPATASFTITEVNDAPVPVNDSLSSVNEDSGLRTISFATLTGNDSKGPANESAQTLTITAVSNPVGGAVNINGTNVEFTPTTNFNGTASFDYTAQDNGTTAGSPDAKTGNGSVSFTVTPIADTPTATPNPASTNEDTQTSGIVIDRNAADGTEVAFFQILNITNGSLFQNDGTTTITNNSFITYVQGNAGLKFTPNANFSGIGSFQVKGSIDGSGTGLSSALTVTINVGSVADVPTITPTTTNEDTQSSSGLVITRNAADGAEVTHFKITNITNGTLFQNNGTTQINNNDFITAAQGTAGLKFTPSPNLYSPVSTFSFDAAGATSNAGAGLGNSATASITVNAVADTPSVSPNPQTTAISTQTGPMVISRNVADSTEVTHFKITNITNGVLYQNDGTTVINNNDFITFAQGSGGLKFTPTAGLSSPANNFGFDVQASLNNTNGGLGGGIVHEDIIVSCSDPQVVTSILDDGSAGTLRYAISNSCPGTGTITFNLPAGPQTIMLGSSLTITKTLTIIGPSNQAVTINGNGNRVLTVTGGSPSISNLTFTGALVSGGNGGGLLNTGTGTIAFNAVTFSGNSADNGGAIATTAGTIVINNSTISGNTGTTNGGGIYVNGGTVSLLNDTITNNTATVGQGGGVNRTAGTVNVRNTIIAGNAAASNANVAGTINDQGNNILSGNPLLAALANNGGPTMTHALLPGSPALDAGDNTAAGALVTDQRGNTFGRFRDAANDADTTQTVDIGSFEADPSLEDITDKSTNEDTALPTFSFRVADTFSAFDSITAISNNQTLVPDANIVISGSGNSRNMDITPAANQFGTATITVTATKTVNSTQVSISDTFVLTVGAVGDTPNVTNASTNEDTQTTSGLVVTRNAADGAEIQNFKITNITGGTLFKNNGATMINNNDFITVAEGGAGLKFTPAPNSFANGSFQVQSSQDNAGTGLSTGAATATITVTAIADTPSVTNATTNEDVQSSSGLAITRNAADGVEVTHFKITGITNGTLFQNNGTTQINNGDFITVAQGGAGLKFTPAADLNTPAGDTFSFQAQAATNNVGGGLSAGSATATITVNAVNDAPSFTRGVDQTVNEDAVAQTVNGWATALSKGPANESSQGLNFIVTNGNNALFLAQPVISSTGNLTYTPAANANGVATVSVQIHDNGGTANGGVDTSAIQTFTITVNAVNDVPSFVKGADQIANEDGGAQTVNNWATALSAGPSNESSQVLNFIVGNNNNSLFSAQPTVSANGTLTYTPKANANGVATVSVQIHDDGGTANGGSDTSAIQTFTITVNAVNDAPVNNVPGPQTVPENSTLTFSTANGNGVSISDVDAGGSAARLTLTATNGVITLGSTAGLAFTVGDGTADPTMTFTGTIASINTALQGMQFIPTNGYSGPATLQIVTNDQGNTGSGGALSDTDTVNITVNDGGTLQFSTSTFTVTENAGPGVITISRTGGSAGTATVQIATSNGTATAASDYTAVTQTVTFNDGEISKTVNIPINDDFLNEPDETVNLTLSNVGGSGALGAQTTAVLTIVNDDPTGGYLKFSAANYSVAEGGIVTITVERQGTLTQAVTVDFATSDDSDPAAMVRCAPTPGNTLASSRCDFTSAFGRIRFAANDGAAKTFKVLTTQDSYVEGPETFNVTLSNPSNGADLGLPSTTTVTINDDLVEPPTNPVDDSDAFVEQLYRDFLNRPSDPTGKAFWINNINHCNDPAQRPAGQTAGQCIQLSRIVTAAAFFFSIEFQATGGTANLTNRAAFGNVPSFVRFERDAQQIGLNYVFGQPGAEVILEANKVAYYNDFVSRPEFVNTYGGVSDQTYVNTLILNTGVSFTQPERDAFTNGLANHTETRATVLRKISEKGSFRAAEFNSMFVLMEYYGFLRRNPDTAGFNFWLNKLNSFNGNYFDAEMVKAFIESNEYRQRFGP
ncbi:MAG: choice-of-anchor Q domain-containing protein [Pyrinomonadaceae bacterium]